MTRMWGVPPEHLCAQHLLGEHAEIHQLVGFIRSGDHQAKLDGHAERGQIDTSLIQQRHDALAVEMSNRGMNHQSPVDYDDELDLGSIDHRQAIEDLRERCEVCAAGIGSEEVLADA